MHCYEHNCSYFFYNLLFILFQALGEYIRLSFRSIYPRPLRSVKGEVVLITGAGHGIGRYTITIFNKVFFFWIFVRTVFWSHKAICCNTFLWYFCKNLDKNLSKFLYCASKYLKELNFFWRYGKYCRKLK